MKVQVYDFRWTNEQECELQAVADGRFARKPVHTGDSISISVLSDPRCAGSTENGIWKPCPKGSTGKAKCEYCRAIEGNFIFTAFDGFDQSQLQPGDLEKIRGEHVVYFALFDAGVLKVGVSKLERKIMRQIEQGSHQTLYWAQTPDGVVARQIETLARRTGLADKIQGRQKKGLLQPAVSLADGQKELQEALEKSLKGFAQAEHLKKFLLDTPEFVAWEEIYHTNELSQISKPLHPITLDTEESVSGKIVAIKGQFLVIETEDELVSLDAKKLLGRDCDFAPLPSGLNIKAALQNSLF